MNTQHVRWWLDALPSYRATAGRLVNVADDGSLSVDPVGAACDVARLHGALIELQVTAQGAMFRTDPGTLPYFVVGEWLGVDLLTLRVRVDELPEPLRSRVLGVLKVERDLRDGPVDWAAEAHRVVRGYDVMDLSDRGVPFTALADALRCVLDVDRHVVVERDNRAAVAS